ncbi:hypothetical protein [Streptomyces sp. f150]|nr:hypothetical protein [Streptomyces sp. f150]
MDGSTFAAADAVQAAYQEHAAAAGVSRLELEMAVKQAVRHPESDSA